MRALYIAAPVVFVVMTMAASVSAVGTGKTVVFEKGGKVVFDGKVHSKAKCNECHPAVFKMKKGADAMTMKDMEAGKFCGVCHNGTKAFGVKDPADCAKCHKK